MKLYKLNKGDAFKVYFYNPYTDEREVTVTGTFLGMDGAYGKVQYDGVEYVVNQISWLPSNTEVERIDE